MQHKLRQRGSGTRKIPKGVRFASAAPLPRTPTAQAPPARTGTRKIPQGARFAAAASLPRTPSSTSPLAAAHKRPGRHRHAEACLQLDAGSPAAACRLRPGRSATRPREGRFDHRRRPGTRRRAGRSSSSSGSGRSDPNQCRHGRSRARAGVQRREPSARRARRLARPRASPPMPPSPHGDAAARPDTPRPSGSGTPRSRSTPSTPAGRGRVAHRSDGGRG